MKNLKYFPFERNRYYYGKLLTEQDFNSEQRYMNDKRRTVNRFLHGVGVAAGFEVVRIDEKSISVEPGFALDGAGRELVLERPLVARLEQIDGFMAIAEQGDCDFAYLCMEYGEEKIMPSHHIASHSSLEEENVEYDKWKEGVHFYLTERPLEQPQDTLDFLFRQRTVLYEDRHLCITQEYPQFAAGGAPFTVSLIVENKGNARECAIELEESLTCASYEGTGRFSCEVKERLEGRGFTKRYDFSLSAFPVGMGEILLSTGPDQLKITCGGRQDRALRDIVLRIPVVAGDTRAAAGERYFKEGMNQILKDAYPAGIYLARISLIRTGKVYLIDEIETMPFGQYVYTPFLTMGLLQSLLEEKEREAPSEKPPKAPPSGMEKRREKSAEGIVEIELGIGGKRGQRFFSHEIIHGLGLGRVHISLGMENGREILFGSSEIFDAFSPKAELAAMADMERGSFVIGARLLEATGQRTIRVCWRAVLEQEKESGAAEAPGLSIRPDKLEMKVRETFYLEAVAKGLSGCTVLWEVMDKGGGSISWDGMYTAPGYPGVYEIQAWCQEQPDIRASLYVIVRE